LLGKNQEFSEIMKRTQLLPLLCIAFTLIVPANVRASTPLQQDNATRLMEEMTPEERIGQLFVVTFNGNSLGELEEIIKLIREHHISGVVLSADFDNFIDHPDTLYGVYDLIYTLQYMEYESSLEPSLIDQTSPTPQRPEYIPLIVAISQEGGGFPYSQILSGLSPIPSQMAIGATWQPEIAKSVGETLGFELQALGFNLLLGPSLDVLEDPRIISPSDLGVRSFGGDPYWVSEMGKAYIEGVHEGSMGRLGVIAKHFPGLGGGDRPSSEEVATVRKSISELEQIDLVPFFEVASNSPGTSPTIADGFLISNIRYQGFQGNIRATTRPVSLDRDAYDQLMALEGLVTWREGGGLTMSDALGSRAIRRFIDSIGQTYKGHLIVKDAFLAGNDLLYLADIRSDDDPDEATTVKSTLAFFAQKYREDAVFAQRVDQSVLRILKFKLRIYNNDFDIDRVIPTREALGTLGENLDVVNSAARGSATLISPAVIEGENRDGSTPNILERIIFISDSRVIRQCSSCKGQLDIPISVLQDEVARLYGSRGAGQIGEWNLSSYSMADLANYLGVVSVDNIEIPLSLPEEFEENLISADWIVFSILRSSPDVYGSDALKKFLDERQDLLIDKKIVVFSHDVPYDLDATDISKIDLYYALYSKPSPFIEYAARLLFNEATAEGNPPVTIPGIGYDLIDITSPDADQVITIQSYLEDGGVIELQDVYQVGDLVRIETNTIVDANGHQVPDGTPVEFELSFQGEGIPSLNLATTTFNGVAQVNVTLDRPGVILIGAESSSARVSELKQITVQGEILDRTQVAPTVVGTGGQEALQTAESSLAPTEEGAGLVEINGDNNSNFRTEEFILGMLGIFLVGGIGYSIASVQHSDNLSRIRFAFITSIGALLGYNYLALGLPGSENLFNQIGQVASLFASIAGGGIALVLALIVRRKGEWN